MEHKNSTIAKSFTTRYNLHHLVFYEKHSSLEDAVKREYQIKRWRREWKEQLINSTNANWKDLAKEWE